MSGVTKDYVVINYNGKPIFVSHLIEGTTESFIKTNDEAIANLTALLKGHREEIAKLETKITILQDEIKKIKGEE